MILTTRPIFSFNVEEGSAAVPAAAPAPEVSTPATPLPVDPPANSHLPADTQINENEAAILDAFDKMQQDDDGDEGEIQQVETVEAQPAPAPPVAQTVPRTPTVEPARTVPAPATATPAAAAAQVPQPSVQPTVPSAAAAPQAGSPEEAFDRLNTEVSKFEGEFTKALAEHYKPSVADLDRYAEDPGAVIAEVAAKVQVKTTQSILRVIHQQLPAVINGLLTARETNQTREKSFWEANPVLKKEQHTPMVSQIGAVWRQMNPNGTQTEFNRAVGAMVSGALGITATAVHTAANPLQVRTPGTVVRSNGSGGFLPAGTSTAPPAAHSTQPTNQWERMFQLIEADERGDFEPQ